MISSEPPSGILCVNCGKKCDPHELLLFQGVGVCCDCHQVADLIVKRGKHELQSLLAVLQEMVRTTLVEGNLHLPRGTEPPTKSEVLAMIVTMKEAHSRRKANRDGRHVRAGLPGA